MEKAISICKEMLEQRGYTIIREEKMLLEGQNKQNLSDKIIVFASSNLKFNVKNIQNYINTMHERKIMHSIIIYVEGVTSFTKKAVSLIIGPQPDSYHPMEPSSNTTCRCP